MDDVLAATSYEDVVTSYHPAVITVKDAGAKEDGRFDRINILSNGWVECFDLSDEEFKIAQTFPPHRVRSVYCDDGD